MIVLAPLSSHSHFFIWISRTNNHCYFLYQQFINHKTQIALGMKLPWRFAAFCKGWSPHPDSDSRWENLPLQLRSIGVSDTNTVIPPISTLNIGEATYENIDYTVSNTRFTHMHTCCLRIGMAGEDMPLQYPDCGASSIKVPFTAVHVG